MQSLKIPSIKLTLVLTLMAVTALLLAASGCEKNPGTPEFTNVFDEENGSGNPLNLTAIVAGGTIVVTWDQPQGQNITNYNIYHGISFSQMDLDTTVVHSAKATNSSILQNAEPTETHFFRISANAGAAYSLYTDQSPAEASTPPRVVVGDGGTALVSIESPVMVTVNRGEYLILADNPQFSNSQTFTIVADGLPQIIDWEFGLAENNESKKELHFQAYNDFYTSPVDSIIFTVTFDPDVTIEGGPSVPSRTLVLNIPTAGVDSMRFSNSEDGLATETWLPPAETYPGYELADIITPQEIFGEFMGDFGFNQTVSLTATPDMLEVASFYLSLPEDRVTDDSQILGICNANATLMRYSESMDFASIPWVPYQDTFLIQLSPEAGRKVIYVQFRNDWADSPILTDYADYISQVGQVTFLAPVAGAILEGGTGFNILGISSAGSNLLEILGVELDLGVGEGFIPVTGTNSWSHLWSIPTSVLDTNIVLRARAYTESDTVTTFVSVTVTGSGEEP